MKRILVIGAGGAAGIGMTRCLQPHFEVYGHDSGSYAKLAQEAIPYIGDDVDLCLPVPDSAVKKYLTSSEFLREKFFLPDSAHVDLCQEKAKCANVLGDLAPKTYWERDTVGAGAAGAKMISEYLPGKNYSHELVYFEGKLLGEFQKERISYLVKHKEPNPMGIGTSAVSVCRNLSHVAFAAHQAIKKVEEETGVVAHGFYGVDLREDENGVPKVTEINAGRLLTASYSYFQLTGYNLPLIAMKAIFGDECPDFVLPDYPEGIGMIRQIDQLPKLISEEDARNF